MNFSEFPKFEKSLINSGIYIRQKGVEKKTHDTYTRLAGAYTKYWWAQQNGFLKSGWG